MTLPSRTLVASTLLAALLAAAPPARAEERGVVLFGGTNKHFLGSEDNRAGGGIGLWTLRPEPRLRWGTLRGEVRYELDYMASTGPGAYEFRPDRTDALGALALYRLSRYRRGQGLYLEAGIGLQYSSQTSHDLPLPLNTTPAGGVGYRFLAGGRAVELGARYFHVSNGGRRPPNGGQNWLFATLSLSF